MAPAKKRGFLNLRFHILNLLSYLFLLLMSFYTDKIHSFQADAPNKSIDALLKF